MKKMSVEEFKKKCPRQENSQTISYYHNDILSLRKDGYKLKDIVDFLAMNNFTTTISNVSRYLKTHMKENISQINKNIQNKPSKSINLKTGLSSSYQPKWAKDKGMPTPEELLRKD